MKGIRMAVLGAALVFGVTTVASAQGGGGGQARGGGRGNQVARLMTDITVSADIQAKIDTIAAKYQAEQRELMTAAAGGAAGGGMQMDDATRAKMTELNAKRNAEIRALLTAEQQAQFDKNVAAMPAGGRRGGGGGGSPPPPPPPPAL
jgi:Spy/CpxP family protein refolding chaperone